MSTPTTTIRVPVQTRDRLAAQARDRGVSIAALLTELASRAADEAIFRAERDVTLAEASAEAVHDEDHDWEQAVDDGIG